MTERSDPRPDHLVWDHLRSFTAVMAHGSLSAAARHLGLTQPTVARHIELLEAALGGSALFSRSPQGLTPTRAAQRLAPHAEAMAASAAALRRAAAGDPDQLSGVVRIAASEVVGVEVLPPILRDIRRAHPGVDFELALSNANADLLRRDADIAIRMVRPRQGALLARKIGDVKLGLYAQESYLDAHGALSGLADFARHTAIGYDDEETARRAVEVLGTPLARSDFAFRSDSDLAQLAALRAGIGIGGCQIAIARRDPKLVRVLAEQVEFKLEMWLAMHGDLSEDPLMRLVFDGLALGLKLHVDAGR